MSGSNPDRDRQGRTVQPIFLKISPNNKIPAMVDSDGPDGQPIAIFESGAMMYLAEKSRWQFLPQDQRRRYYVVHWLMFQMASVGPMLGQAHHFRRYAPKQDRSAPDRSARARRDGRGSRQGESESTRQEIMGSTFWRQAGRAPLNRLLFPVAARCAATGMNAIG